MKSWNIRTTKKNRRFTPKRLALGGLVVVVLLGLLWTLDKKNIINVPFGPSESAQTNPSSPNDINYQPPTEQEKKETEDFKNKIGSDNSTNTPSTPGQKKTMTPVISSWGQDPQTKDVDATGFVQGIYENGGTCTLALQKGDQKVTEQKTATKDAQVTTCGLIKVIRNRLSPGSWTMTLSYSSTAAEGSSQAVTLEVQ